MCLKDAFSPHQTDTGKFCSYKKNCYLQILTEVGGFMKCVHQSKLFLDELFLFLVGDNYLKIGCVSD